MNTHNRILPKRETELHLLEDPEGDIVPVNENELVGPEPDDYEEEEESDDDEEDGDEVDLIDPGEEPVDPDAETVRPDEDEEGREVMQVLLEPRIKIEDLPVVEIAPPEGNNEGEKGEKEEYEVEEKE